MALQYPSSYPEQAGICAGVQEPMGSVTLQKNTLQLDESGRGVADGHASEQGRETRNEREARHDPDTPTLSIVPQARTANSRNTGIHCSVGGSIRAGSSFARRQEQPCVVIA